MKHPHYLSISEQRRLLAQRGIDFSNNKYSLIDDELKIREIGFYKLKEFAQVYAFKSPDSFPKYGLRPTFSDVLTRYYQDKNLRMQIFHVTESIEVFLNNQISDLLGKKYGPFGYLDFNNWINRNYSKFTIEKKQYIFKKQLLNKIRRSSLPDIKSSVNLERDGFPTVWVMTDCLTFGDTVHLIESMSKNNQKIIAHQFHCRPKELVSWLKCLNFIRNICAHNNDFIDIQIRTKPIAPREYKQYLFKTKNRYTNKVAISILIIKQMMKYINPKYSFKDIKKSLRKLCKDDAGAHQLGFKDIDAVFESLNL